MTSSLRWCQLQYDIFSIMICSLTALCSGRQCLKSIRIIIPLFHPPPSGFVKDVARPDYWVPDENIIQCHQCSKTFTPAMSKHHCRACGQGVCGPCSTYTRPVPSRGWDHPVRVCDSCHARKDSLWPPQPGILLKVHSVFLRCSTKHCESQHCCSKTTRRNNLTTVNETKLEWALFLYD